ncbi:MAG: S-layer protein domain-containing protein [Methanothrix sp.]|nr:S-layer protein domain-containing protein [Methanothrix sp.]
MMLLLATAMTVGAVSSVDIRGAVAGTVNGQSNLESDSFTWNPQNFAGFYYDIKKDIGTETLVTSLTETNKLSGDAPYGVTYTTTAQAKDYEFEDWGSYKVIGFQAEKYFAGYTAEKYFAGYTESADADKNVFFKESTDENSLSSEQLEKILVDDDTEKTVTSGTPLKLEEGYELSIKSIDIDGNKVYLELSKDGSVGMAL